MFVGTQSDSSVVKLERRRRQGRCFELEVSSNGVANWVLNREAAVVKRWLWWSSVGCSLEEDDRECKDLGVVVIDYGRRVDGGTPRWSSVEDM